MLKQLELLQRLEEERARIKTVSVNRFVEIYKQKYESEQLILAIDTKEIVPNKFGYVAKIVGICDGTNEFQNDEKFLELFKNNEVSTNTINLSKSVVNRIKPLKKKHVFLFIDTEESTMENECETITYHKIRVKGL